MKKILFLLCLTSFIVLNLKAYTQDSTIVDKKVSVKLKKLNGKKRYQLVITIKPQHWVQGIKAPLVIDYWRQGAAPLTSIDIPDLKGTGCWLINDPRAKGKVYRASFTTPSFDMEQVITKKDMIQPSLSSGKVARKVVRDTTFKKVPITLHTTEKRYKDSLTIIQRIHMDIKKYPSLYITVRFQDGVIQQESRGILLNFLDCTAQVTSVKK